MDIHSDFDSSLSYEEIGYMIANANAKELLASSPVEICNIKQIYGPIYSIKKRKRSREEDTDVDTADVQPKAKRRKLSGQMRTPPQLSMVRHLNY